MEEKFDQIKYQNEFNRKTYKAYSIRVRRDRNDIIEKLDSVPSVNAYVIGLVEKDMNTTDAKAVKRYNSIMNSIAREYLTIGTKLSENTKGWNLRDMVAECDAQLKSYYEGGTSNSDLKYEDPQAWRSETGKLKRFIDHYKDQIEGIVCTDWHDSKYDNKG